MNALLDHFHPPLRGRRHWHSFHNNWATYLAADLNARLPPNYFAEANAQFGIEIDIATFEVDAAGEAFEATWSPPSPTMTLPLTLVTDVVEVLVFYNVGGPVLAGAVEFVSPANKDRPASREAFATKCQSYLQQAVGVIVVDVVTERRGSLHNHIVAGLDATAPTSDADLYAAAYRPAADDTLQIWHEPLGVGRPLPTMPLWLRSGPCLPADLQATYDRTCREQRIA